MKQLIPTCSCCHQLILTKLDFISKTPRYFLYQVNISLFNEDAFTRKFIVPLFIFLFFTAISFAQQKITGSQNRFRFNNERLKIDSLIKLLPSLKDSVRIDCLNSLRMSISEIDTAQYYTALAFTCLTKKILNYYCKSLSSYAYIQNFKRSFSSS